MERKIDKKRLPCPGAVKALAWCEGISAAIIFPFFLFVSKGNWLFSLAVLIVYVVIEWAVLARFRNLLERSWISEKGVGNRYHSIPWEDVSRFRMFFLRHYKMPYPYLAPEEGEERRYNSAYYWRRSLFDRGEDYPPIVCIGPEKEGGFFRQDPRQCVFLAVDRVNYDALRRFCAAPNETMTQVLERFALYVARDETADGGQDATL